MNGGGRLGGGEEGKITDLFIACHVPGASIIHDKYRSSALYFILI